MKGSAKFSDDEKDENLSDLEAEKRLSEWKTNNPNWIEAHSIPPQNCITYYSIFWLSYEEMRHLTLFYLESIFYNLKLKKMAGDEGDQVEGGNSHLEDIPQDLLILIIVFVINPFDAESIFDLFSFFRVYENQLIRTGIFGHRAFWKCLITLQFQQKDYKYKIMDMEERKQRFESVLNELGEPYATRRSQNHPDLYAEIEMKVAEKVFKKRCLYWSSLQDYFWDVLPELMRNKIVVTQPKCKTFWNDAPNTNTQNFTEKMTSFQKEYRLHLIKNDLLESSLNWLTSEAKIKEWLSLYMPLGSMRTFLSSGGSSRTAPGGTSSLYSEDAANKLTKYRLCDEALFYEYLVKSLLGHELKTFNVKDSKKVIVPNGLRKIRMGFVHDCLWLHQDWNQLDRFRELKDHAKRNVDLAYLRRWDKQFPKTYDIPQFRGQNWYHDDEMVVTRAEFPQIDSGNPKTEGLNSFEYASMQGISSEYFEGGPHTRKKCHLGVYTNQSNFVFIEEEEFQRDLGERAEEQAKYEKLKHVLLDIFNAKTEETPGANYLFSMDQLYENMSDSNQGVFDVNFPRKNEATCGKSVVMVGPFHILSWKASLGSYKVHILPFCFHFKNPQESLNSQNVFVRNYEKSHQKFENNNSKNKDAWIFYKTRCTIKNGECSKIFPSFGTVVGCSSSDHCTEGRLFDGSEIKISSEGKVVIVLDYQCYLETLIEMYSREIRLIENIGVDWGMSSSNGNRFSKTVLSYPVEIIEKFPGRLKKAKEEYELSFIVAKQELMKLTRRWSPLFSTTKIVFSVTFNQDKAQSMGHSFVGIMDPLALDRSTFLNDVVSTDHPKLRLNAIPVEYAKSCNENLFDVSWKRSNINSIYDVAPYRFEAAEDFENSHRRDKSVFLATGNLEGARIYLGLNSETMEEEGETEEESLFRMQRLCFNPIIQIAVSGTSKSTCVAFNFFHGNSVIMEEIATEGSNPRDPSSNVKHQMIHSTVQDKYKNWRMIVARKNREALFDTRPNNKVLSIQENFLFLVTMGFRRHFEMTSSLTKNNTVVNTTCYLNVVNNQRFTNARGKWNIHNEKFLFRDCVFRHSSIINLKGQSEKNVVVLPIALYKPKIFTMMHSLIHTTEDFYENGLETYEGLFPEMPFKVRSMNIKTLVNIRTVPYQNDRAGDWRAGDIWKEEKERKQERKRDPNDLNQLPLSKLRSNVPPYLVEGLEFGSTGINLLDSLCVTLQSDGDTNGCKSQSEGTFLYDENILLKCYTGYPAPYVNFKGDKVGEREFKKEYAWHPLQFMTNRLPIRSNYPNVTRPCMAFPIALVYEMIKNEATGIMEEKSNLETLAFKEPCYRAVAWADEPQIAPNAQQTVVMAYLNRTNDNPTDDKFDGTQNFENRWKTKTVCMHPDPYTNLLFTDLETQMTIKWILEVPSKTICVYKNLHIGMTINGDLIVHQLPSPTDVKAEIEGITQQTSTPNSLLPQKDAYSEEAPVHLGKDFTCPVVHRRPLFATNARYEYNAADPQQHIWYQDPVTCSQIYEKGEDIYVVFSRSFEKSSLSRFNGVFPDYPGFRDKVGNGHGEPHNFSACKRIPSKFELEGFKAQDPNFWICIKLSTELLTANKAIKRHSLRSSEVLSDEWTTTTTATSTNNVLSEGDKKRRRTTFMRANINEEK